MQAMRCSASTLGLHALFAAGRVLICGTDTGIGKTRVACALLHAARSAGLRSIGLKPVASGCGFDQNGAMYNEDVLALRAASSASMDYADHNFVQFAAAIAPHLAAKAAGVVFDRSAFLRWLGSCAPSNSLASHDFTVIEGAGGWLSPLLPKHASTAASAATLDVNETDLDHAELAVLCEASPVLVVGLRLGCINHARMSARLMQSQTNYLGWIANFCDPNMAAAQQNLDALIHYLGAPLAVLDFGAGRFR